MSADDTTTTTTTTTADGGGRPRIAYWCACGYVHENGPDNWVNVSPGDHCVKCGRQFAPSDRHTRHADDLFEWDTDTSIDIEGGPSGADDAGGDAA